ncbi:MAG: hypothetical protein K9L68_03805 [Spirochaetales bacterium]|nr:hypothetical protein [Spirochaetales bacterium]MCF7937704.1 hypothetical protein [Spirochaetales bacterium]
MNESAVSPQSQQQTSRSHSASSTPSAGLETSEYIPGLEAHLTRVRELFRIYFDNSWFVGILERMSFNSLTLHEIRRMLEMRSSYVTDSYRLLTGVRALEELVAFTRRYVLPVIRDELGVSGFTRHKNRSQDPITQVVKGLFSATFPANLMHLEELTTELTEMTRPLSSPKHRSA